MKREKIGLKERKEERKGGVEKGIKAEGETRQKWRENWGEKGEMISGKKGKYSSKRKKSLNDN